MTDDHTPIEFSFILGKNGLPHVRFAIDPIERQESGRTSPLAFFSDIAKTSPSWPEASPDVDLSWCRVCAEELTDTTEHPTPITARYPSQYFAGMC
jgi:hypothetical protein